MMFSNMKFLGASIALFGPGLVQSSQDMGKDLYGFLREHIEEFGNNDIQRDAFLDIPEIRNLRRVSDEVDVVKTFEDQLETGAWDQITIGGDVFTGKAEDLTRFSDTFKEYFAKQEDCGFLEDGIIGGRLEWDAIDHYNVNDTGFRQCPFAEDADPIFGVGYIVLLVIGGILMCACIICAIANATNACMGQKEAPAKTPEEEGYEPMERRRLQSVTTSTPFTSLKSELALEIATIGQTCSDNEPLGLEAPIAELYYASIGCVLQVIVLVSGYILYKKCRAAKAQKEQKMQAIRGIEC